MTIHFYYYFGPTLSLKTQKILQTTLYAMTQMILGLAFALLGPSLPQLASNNNSSLSTMGAIFTSRGVGWMCGSFLFGFLYDRFPPHPVMASAFIAVSVCMTALPLSVWNMLSFSIMFLQALGMSGLAVGSNTLLIWVWKEKVGPPMQLLHFFFGVGASTAPFVLALLYKWVDSSYQATNATYYLFSGSHMMMAIFCFFVPGPTGKGEEGLEQLQEDENNQENELPELEIQEDLPPVSKNSLLTHPQFKYWVVTIFVGSYLLLYVGIEQGYSSWLASIGVFHFGMSEIEASYITSGFWATMTVSRLLMVPISFFVGEVTLLTVYTVTTLVAVFPLAFVENGKIVLWVCSLLLGFGLGPIFGMAFSLPSHLGYTLSGKSSSGILIAGGIGDMAVPIILGFLLSLGTNYLIWGVIVTWGMASILFFLVIWIPHFLGKYPMAHKKKMEIPCLDFCCRREQTRYSHLETMEPQEH